MSQHPLLELAADRDVRQAKGFREAASRLDGKTLASHYQRELEAAPRRVEAGGRFLAQHSSRIPKQRRAQRDDEHLARALVRFSGEAEGPLSLPRQGGPIHFVEHAVPLAPDPAEGAVDPWKALGRANLLARGPEDVLVVGRLRFVASDSNRTGTGDTPLRHLLEGLAQTAVAEANRAALSAEIIEAGGKPFSEDPPLLLLLGSPRYWQLCRKREAQKGAAWIKELERLVREVTEELGLQVVWGGLELDRNPGWSYDEQGPILDAPPVIDPAWERHAGRLRPKAPPKPKDASEADIVVEADLSRPVRSYSIRESYEPGDRIQHTTLGMGVVQRGAGPGKIFVRFDEKQSLLIHGRG